MTPVVEVSGLRKEYRRRGRGRSVAVDGLDLAVPEGGVFGFLGPNGSGKTTTIRCLLGLVAPSDGTCRVLGADTRTELPRVIDRIGAVVETPCAFPTFTGRANLELLGRMVGIGPRAVDGVLVRVGLSERADDLVRTYSLGMRQRLGIGAALLKDPDLLVLDEPANGLDPAGIREIRLLVRELADEGRTVFVSSHLLNEIEQTCDAVAILDRGRCVLTGSVREVLDGNARAGLRVRVDDELAALRVLADEGIATLAGTDGLSVDLPAHEAARVTRVLAARDLWVTELRPETVTLEDLFLELTGGGGAGAWSDDPSRGRSGPGREVVR